ncbi:hypothetical protein P3X46_029116 [Hevea brasiliensis]|uniref:GDSL esterase/lipase n=1 Tax=Hevea brasiliensis TaxID=3981 RepID=A0ABQ9KSY3_HEVBR|nr:hypothetical protein P3X46_029116 [Hevea brasiliensis]
MAKGGCSGYFLLLIILCMVATNLGAVEDVQATIFIFGDSTVDVGTNNILNGSAALANFLYNGIDFPHSIPTGSFSNGFNIADHPCAVLFGYEKSPQPYLYLVKNMSVLRKEILRGLTLHLPGRVVPLRKQIQQLALVRGNISELKGPEEAAKIISNSLDIFSVGSNDILDPVRLGTNLTMELLAVIRLTCHQHRKNLYNMGGRKFAIIPAAPIGCCPFSRAINKNGGGDGGSFYTAVDTLLQNMSLEFPEMKYSLGNVYKMTKYIFKNYRFNETKKACCGSGDYNGVGYCNKAQNPNLCENRDKCLFWDLYHPSQAATLLSASTLYNRESYYMKPMNFSLLAQLQL